MAAAALSLCNPLCFLLCKYDKMPIKVLKRAMLDFYDSGVISNAKKQLLSDISQANFQENVPTVPERRAGEMRTINEIDDIFALIAFLDERKLLSRLPLYVSDNPDNMPSFRLYEGDLKILMSKLDMMNDKLTSHGMAIAAIVSDLDSRFSKSGPVANSANVHHSTTNQGVINNTDNALSTHTVSDTVIGDSTYGTRHMGGELSKSTDVRQISKSWADRAAAISTPRHSRSQMYASSTATDDDLKDNPYTVKHSRNYSRAVKRKVNNGYTPPEPDQPQQQRSKVPVSAQRNSHQAVYGRSTDGDIVAANKLVKKAVFCIDNINVSFNTDDIVNHVHKLGIDVISCFEAKPRIRRSDSYTNNRKAFRLCISSKHRDKLLNSLSWPDSVVVSEWFFKSQQTTSTLQATSLGKRPRAETPSNQQRLEREISTLKNNAALICDENVPNKPNEAQTVRHSDNDDTDDMELTIITQFPNEIIQGQPQPVNITASKEMISKEFVDDC